VSLNLGGFLLIVLPRQKIRKIKKNIEEKNSPIKANKNEKLALNHNNMNSQHRPRFSPIVLI
jgi:hypothetical protein